MFASCSVRDAVRAGTGCDADFGVTLGSPLVAALFGTTLLGLNRPVLAGSCQSFGVTDGISHLRRRIDMVTISL